jgi:thiol-disulfide isomerase/thioredoxin
MRRLAPAWVLSAVLLFPSPGAGGDRDIASALDGYALGTLDGGTAFLDEGRGRVLLVNFWASWCAPCRKELPFLDRLYEELSPRGLMVAAVSVDRDPDNAARFVERRGLGLPVYLDGPSGLADRLNLSRLPFTALIDPGGRTVYTARGTGDRDLEELRSAVMTELERAGREARR